MKNTLAEIEQSRAAMQDACMKAYGQIHNTPDGSFCWMGRIDRAYEKSKTNPNNEKVRSAIRSLEFLAMGDMADAEKKRASYLDMCRANMAEWNDTDIECGCPYCQRVPNGVYLLFGVQP